MLPHYSRHFVAKAALLAGAGLLALAVGCSRDKVSHFRVPKEAVADHPDHPGHEDHAAPGQGMPPAGKNEATVVVLPGAAGGELANVNRWRGQIGLGPIDEAALAAARVVVKTKAGALNVYDFTSDGQTKSRMVAGLISTPDGNTWFLKLTGDAGPVAKAKPDFMRILGSLSLD